MNPRTDSTSARALFSLRLPALFFSCVSLSALAIADEPAPAPGGDPAEAPTGFDGLTNGFITQAELEAARRTFEEREEARDGLGPVFNGQSCVECHHTPVTGGSSQVTEVRAGHLVERSGFRRYRSRGVFEAAPGGSLIQDRALDPAIKERVPESEDVMTLRASLNALGDGFLEAVLDQTLEEIARTQPSQSRGRIRGEAVRVPVLEAGGALRIGRFGWKAQHASLQSFAADAYLNEMGITSPLLPIENTALGMPVGGHDAVKDPEDDGADVLAFTSFLRATTAPPRDAELAAAPEAVAGSRRFEEIGCVLCHVARMVTAPPGSKLNGGTLVVPEALGSKAIHPYSDLLLHDVGTGDGIVQNGGQGTAQKLRTPPLWGVRLRTRLMHDGASLTFRDAILRHDGEAAFVTERFRRLGAADQRAIVQFLLSL